MKGIARCALCKREVEFERSAPGRCRVRDGGCGASGGIRVLRTPSRALDTAGYVPERPALSALARDLEEALAR